MEQDDALLAGCPDFISVGNLFKARPVEEGGERTLYFEASNEDLDHQNEVILQKALSDSSDYYLRHGNVDLSHWSLLGPKSGIPNFMEYEIGKPVEVRVDGPRTFVKAQLYRGDSARARNANLVWDSLTAQVPPSTYFPSVGGSVLEKSVKVDPLTGKKVAVITRVMWNNVALDRCPVNKTVPEVSTAPIGTFTKSLNGFVISKSLEAGYGSDSATLAGGEALRVQSLDKGVKSYAAFRDALADAIGRGHVAANDKDGLVREASVHFGLPAAQAARFVERFLSDLKRGIKEHS